MSKAAPSDAGPHESTASEDDELASFPAPPPLPRERAAARARRQTEVPPLPAPPPLPSSPESSRPGQDPKSPPPLAPAVVPSRRTRTSLGPWLVYGLGALIVLGLGATAFFFANRSEDSVEEETAPQRARAGSATDLVGGERLLIDARPWGEVTSVVDSRGEAIELPPDRQTPLVLDLAPGRYTVFLTHPDLADQRVSCEAEVSASVGASCRLDLLPVTLEDYWEEIGWGR